MGAFFTNVQLKTSTLDQAGLIENVIKHIALINDKAGFVRVDNEEDADKTVIVFPSDDLSWISIYDEETEDQDIEQLNRLASELSKQLKITTLSILVNDSDTIYLGIHANGTLKDSISNLEDEIDFNKNKPAAWADILVGNHSFEDVRNAWEKEDVFVEDFLTRFAALTNLDVSKLLTGYAYLEEEHPNEGIRLNFKQKNKKKVADPGLTKFSMLSGIPLIDVKAGEKKELEWMLTNQGQSSTGLDVVITGECIDQELLIPDTLKASYLTYTDGKQHGFVVPFNRSVATTGEKIVYARIKEMYIPEGIQPVYPMSPKDAERNKKNADACTIRFNIGFIGGNEGSGSFNIFFSPMINRQEGSYYAQMLKGTVEDFLNKNS